MTTDSRGQSYETIGPIRLTYVRAEDRPKAKNWAGRDVIRIQAHLDGRSKGRLHKGAEIPVEPGVVLEVIEAICRLTRAASR